MNRLTKYRMFYATTLLSSVGNMTYVGCLVAFMMSSGYSFAQIGLTLALSRAIPLLINTFLGDLSDRKHPFAVMALSDVAAVAISLAMLVVWSFGKDYFHVFLALSVLRSSAVSLQGGAHGKVAKLLAEAEEKAHRKNAVLLTIATQGANLISGVLGFLLVRHFTFEAVIIFDTITFLVSAVMCARFYSVGELPLSTDSVKNIWTQWIDKFQSLYRFCASTAAKDVALALVMIGTATLDGVFAQGNKELVLVFVTSYGLAMWVSGFFLNHTTLKVENYVPLLWLAVGVFFGLTFYAVGKSMVLVIAFSFIKDFFYALLFHVITCELQQRTPSEKMAGVTSARAVQMVLILALGEFVVGSWQGVMTPTAEATWRFGVCAIAAAVALISLRRGKVNA